MPTNLCPQFYSQRLWIHSGRATEERWEGHVFTENGTQRRKTATLFGKIFGCYIFWYQHPNTTGFGIAWIADCFQQDLAVVTKRLLYRMVYYTDLSYFQIRIDKQKECTRMKHSSPARS